MKIFRKTYPPQNVARSKVSHLPCCCRDVLEILYLLAVTRYLPGRLKGIFKETDKLNDGNESSCDDVPDCRTGSTAYDVQAGLMRTKFKANL